MIPNRYGSNASSELSRREENGIKRGDFFHSGAALQENPDDIYKAAGC